MDLPLLVERSANGEVLSEIPRLPQPTLAHGVQLLVDRSSALTLYSADQKWLLDKIQRVVGAGKISVLEFAGSPLLVFNPENLEALEPYLDCRMPPPGTVVATLTDLGIGRPTSISARSTVAQWLELGRRLHLRQCPLVAFVPYGPARWPAALREAFTIVHWDWVTNTNSIQAVAGKGLDASI